jgi:hypothetical protein
LISPKETEDSAKNMKTTNLGALTKTRKIIKTNEENIGTKNQTTTKNTGTNP